MSALLPGLLLLSACNLVIDADEHARRLDADGDGYKSVVHGGDDCDDGDADVHPGASELCNQVDDDCDDSIDEGAIDPVAWAQDGDGDGFPDPTKQQNACVAPGEDWVAYGSVADDCDDSDDGVHPGAEEICDGVDQDCDEDVDEDVWVDGYADLDDDGWGDPEAAMQGCPGAEGFSTKDGDCDDTDDTVHLGAEETCGNGIDEDCDDRDETCPELALSDAPLQGRGHVATDRYGHAFDMLGPLAVVSSPSGELGMGGAWLLPSPLDGDLDADSAVFDIEGLAPANEFGWAVALHPELLDIPRPTLVISAPETGGGTLYLFDVEATGATRSTDADMILTSSQASAELGFDLARADDLDGDRTSDLLVGAPGHDSGAGAVWVVPGHVAVGGVVSTDWPHLLGAESGDNAGISVATADDYDGDGVQDVVVGSWLAGGTQGMVFVVSGPLAAGPGALADADVIIDGHEDGDLLGYPVAGGGDIDGDGLADIAAMAVGLEPEFGTLGHTFVFTGLDAHKGTTVGAASATARIEQDDPLDADSQDGLGLALGDLDGDGRADLAMGMPNHEQTGYGAGAVYLFMGPIEGSNSAGSADYALYGVDPGGEAGFAIAAGDLDADGAFELFVADPGAEGERGRVFLYPGTTW